MLRATRKLSMFVLVMLIATLVVAGCSGTSSTTGNSSSAASGSSSASGSAVDVQVTLTEFSITSSLTTFKVGTPYHFVVTNKGTAPHEFQIMPPATGTLTQDQITAMSLAGIGQADLTAGATKTLDYTFTQAYPQGALEFACHLPGHYEAGMHLPIVVTQ